MGTRRSYSEAMSGPLPGAALRGEWTWLGT